MLKEKRFFYKARRTDNNEIVIGRIGSTHSSSNGIETSMYFFEYIGDKCDNANWSQCIVDANSIELVDL